RREEGRGRRDRHVAVGERPLEVSDVLPRGLPPAGVGPGVPLRERQAVIALLANVLAQDPTKESDIWSRLLGIERVQISRDADWSLPWPPPPPAWVLFLLIIPAVIFVVAMIYRRERQDVGVGSKVVLTVLRAALIVLTLLLLMGPVLTVETIKKRK